jgi:hypothetical protein
MLSVDLLLYVLRVRDIICATYCLLLLIRSAVHLLFSADDDVD